MLPLLLNLQWLRLIVNTLGGLGFPGILFDTQLGAMLYFWWHRH